MDKWDNGGWKLTYHCQTVHGSMNIKYLEDGHVSWQTINI